MNKAFDMEKIMSFFNYIYYFFILNLLFLLSNLPFLGFFFLVGISRAGEYLPSFLLCLLPLGPSLCALFYCMNKLIKNKDLYPVRSYFKGYFNNFKQSAVIAAMQLSCAFIICASMRFFEAVPEFSAFSIILLIELALLLLITPFLYLLISRYQMKMLEIIKASFVIVIGKPLYAIGNAVVFLFVLMLFELIAGTTFLFIGSLYAFLIALTNKTLFRKLEG